MIKMNDIYVRGGDEIMNVRRIDKNHLGWNYMYFRKEVNYLYLISLR